MSGVALLGAAATASAAHVSLFNITTVGNSIGLGDGTLDLGDSWTNSRTIGQNDQTAPYSTPFEDYYSFQLGATGVMNSTFKFELSDVSQISNMNWALYDGTVSVAGDTATLSGTQKAGSAVSLPNQIYNQLITGLTPGSYVLAITGDVTGMLNGIYNTGLKPVPVPPAVFLFGAGLVGLVAVARRRNNGAETGGEVLPA